MNVKLEMRLSLRHMLVVLHHGLHRLGAQVRMAVGHCHLRLELVLLMLLLLSQMRLIGYIDVLENFKVQPVAKRLHVPQQDHCLALSLLRALDLFEVLQQKVVLNVDEVRPHVLDELVAEELHSRAF